MRKPTLLESVHQITITTTRNLHLPNLIYRSLLELSRRFRSMLRYRLIIHIFICVGNLLYDSKRIRLRRIIAPTLLAIKRSKNTQSYQTFPLISACDLPISPWSYRSHRSSRVELVLSRSSVTVIRR